MPHPLVSAVVPVYNGQEHIERCLISIIRQEYRHIEIIVINDGSTDGTEKRLDSFRERITYRRQENAGVSSARNAGIELARGKYVAFLDSDDVWHPSKLRLQVALCEKMPDFGICRCLTATDGVDSFQNSDVVGNAYYLTSTFDSILESPYYGPSTVIIRRAALLEVGMFDENLKTAEDLDLFLRVGYRHPLVIHLNSKLTFKEWRSTSLGNRLSSYEDNIAVLDKFCADHPRYATTNKHLVVKARDRVLKDYATTLVWQKEYRRGRAELLHLLRRNFDVKTVGLLARSYVSQARHQLAQYFSPRRRP